MRESIKIIKYCSKASLVFLLLTYVVSVNIEVHFMSIDSMLISNNFLITMFGGVFASMLVVVLCEVQKYLNVKTNTEEYLFYQSVYLYQALMQMRINIEDYLKHCEWQVPANLFDESIRMIQCEMNALQLTDYATFEHGNDSLMIEHGRFRIESLSKMQPILLAGIRLRLAINETEYYNLQKQLETHTYLSSNKQIASESPRVARILNDELKRVCLSVSLMDSYITAIDNYCNQRFKWDEMKVKFVFIHLGDTCLQI